MKVLRIMILCAVVIILIGQAILYLELHHDYDKLKLYYPDIDGIDWVEGVYTAPDYYCVWTRGLNNSAINDNAVHEACHDLIYDYREHFCGNQSKIMEE